MKRLLGILLLAAVGFMAVAIAQEWPVFAAALGLSVEAQGPALDAAQRQAAAEAVQRFASIKRHYYNSDGDPRFAERLPATPEAIAELAADLAYLKRNGRRQELTLEQLEVIEVTMRGERGAAVVTRERWSARLSFLADGQSAEPPRSSAVECSYLLRHEGSGWLVAGWDLLPPLSATAAPGSGGG